MAVSAASEGYLRARATMQSDCAWPSVNRSRADLLDQFGTRERGDGHGPSGVGTSDGAQPFGHVALHWHHLSLGVVRAVARARRAVPAYLVALLAVRERKARSMSRWASFLARVWRLS